MTTKPLNKKYTARQVAEALNVTPETVKRWINEGKVKASRLPGGAYRIDQKEYDRLTGGA
jgi:excisionase family DNA binding protein